MITILILSLFFHVLTAPPVKVMYVERAACINPYIRILNVISQVESADNCMAYNAKENAVGLLQVRQIRLDDYNKKTGATFVLSDMYDSTNCVKVFMHYASQYRWDDYKAIAIDWNGRSVKNKYWSKVKKLL